MDAIEQQVIENLKRICGGSPTPQDSLALLGIDSVGMAELTFDLEKQFSIQVDDGVLDIETVGELVDYVKSRQIENGG